MNRNPSLMPSNFPNSIQTNIRRTQAGNITTIFLSSVVWAEVCARSRMKEKVDPFPHLIRHENLFIKRLIRVNLIGYNKTISKLWRQRCDAWLFYLYYYQLIELLSLSSLSIYCHDVLSHFHQFRLFVMSLSDIMRLFR